MLDASDLTATNLRPQVCVGAGGDAPLDPGLSETLARFNATLGDKVPPRYQQRFLKSLVYVRWFLRANLGRTPIRALEIGCADGPKSLALADICESYDGIDLNPDLIQGATRLSSLMGLSNVQFEVCEANDTPGFLGQRKGRYNLVILYAVLEHLTIEEKLNLLRLCWEYLEDDGVLMIGETPNRLLPIDYHSSKLIYFQQMPPELWKRYLARSPNDEWRSAMELGIAENDFETMAYRRGLHVGPQEFDLAIKDVESLSEHVIADNYDVSMLNLYPLHPVEVLKLAEFDHLSTFGRGVKIAGREFPPLFSRYYMEALLRKAPPRVRPGKVFFLYPQIDRHGAEPGFLGEERRVGPQAPLILAPRDTSDAPLDISITLNCRSSSGRMVVRDARGAAIFDRSADDLAEAFGRRKANATFSLPRLTRAQFPVTVKAWSRIDVRYVIGREVLGVS